MFQQGVVTSGLHDNILLISVFLMLNSVYFLLIFRKTDRMYSLPYTASKCTDVFRITNMFFLKILNLTQYFNISITTQIQVFINL